MSGGRSSHRLDGACRALCVSPGWSEVRIATCPGLGRRRAASYQGLPPKKTGTCRRRVCIEHHRLAIQPVDAVREVAKSPGRPHDGHDHEANILVLCPNHHALFDFGALSVTETFQVLNTVTDAFLGELRRLPRHEIDPAALAYHREHIARL